MESETEMAFLALTLGIFFSKLSFASNFACKSARDLNANLELYRVGENLGISWETARITNPRKIADDFYDKTISGMLDFTLLTFADGSNHILVDPAAYQGGQNIKVITFLANKDHIEEARWYNCVLK